MSLMELGYWSLRWENLDGMSRSVTRSGVLSLLLWAAGKRDIKMGFFLYSGLCRIPSQRAFILTTWNGQFQLYIHKPLLSARRASARNPIQLTPKFRKPLTCKSHTKFPSLTSLFLPLGTTFLRNYTSPDSPSSLCPDYALCPLSTSLSLSLPLSLITHLEHPT